MKKILFAFIALFSMALIGCSQTPKNNPKEEKEEKVAGGTVIHLTNEEFKKLVFDYETNKDWKFLGDKPCIIDFYADWCAPCRQMSPRLDELAKQYAGQIVIYKVNTDKEQQLASAMGIQSLPTLLFVPKNGQPQGSVGALPKETLEKAIKDVLLK